MASIRKRGRSWQAQVRSRKTGSIGKSFHRKVDAERWAIEQEALMQNGRFAQLQTQDLTLHDLGDRSCECLSCIGHIVVGLISTGRRNKIVKKKLMLILGVNKLGGKF